MISKNENSLIIYGCGGHARSVADVALVSGFPHLTFVDKNARPKETIFGFDVLANYVYDETMSIFPAIGDNHARSLLFNQLKKENKNIASIISSRGYVGINAKIGKGVFAGHNSHIGPNAEIGDNTILNTQTIVDHDCKVGKHCHISANTMVAGQVTIGDFVFVGTGATVIDNVIICSNVIIGAGAVVTTSITEPGTYVGVPARKIK